jgi:hypothetical protein
MRAEVARHLSREKMHFARENSAMHIPRLISSFPSPETQNGIFA